MATTCENTQTGIETFVKMILALSLPLLLTVPPLLVQRNKPTRTIVGPNLTIN
jgi:hypothetical protein